MSIETRCRRWGRPFVADRAAIVAGRWRLCPAWRAPSPPGALTGAGAERGAGTLRSTRPPGGCGAATYPSSGPCADADGLAE